MTKKTADRKATHIQGSVETDDRTDVTASLNEEFSRFHALARRLAGVSKSEIQIRPKAKRSKKKPA